MIKSEEQAFEFTGGNLSLDFTNTVDSRGMSQPRELLNSYPDLVSWSEQAGIISSSKAQELAKKEESRRSEEAALLLKRAKTLREAIYSIFSAVVDGHSHQETDLDTLNAEIAAALPNLKIVSAENGFQWEWATEGQTLEKELWTIARSAADLLTSDQLAKVSKCANSWCGWLFIDTSKNRSRRWCDMKTCGNRAKNRQYYQRKKAGEVR